ncbi:hypothetical protein OM076_35550 [Solirubrobacter ginsenosidimutans]|uniref:Uncharacterized protein n=1 Tax=Solirubrobacter ginsenosidimutans TaxID=490573 RepID=A0A9X3N2T1_9ACTN|nr:hypothetical protein [Solirubrobacter ginsenosidimutans]MDA0165637.1 hypothetical protein [Solirubrobacter ginsenosidimutans]
MHILPPSERFTARRLAPAVTAALVSVAVAAPVAGAQSAITVDAAKDSVQVSGLPLGMATLQITRPDLKTGAPVVTGQYQGLALFGLPFGVNTTAPSLLNPAGDCWQKGALSLSGDLGLTPDILPGDTVSVTGGGPTLTVPAQTAAGDGTTGGPIAGCDTLSLWGRNEVKTASFASAGGDLAVTGQAQPGTKSVTVKATDSADLSTDEVAATLASDGSYTATIPAAALAELADGALNVSADYNVPDVATGNPADIGGPTLSVDKQTPATPADPEPQPEPQPAAPSAPKISLHGLLAKKKITLRSLRAGKLRASFIVPTGANYVRVRLSKNRTTKAKVIAQAAAAGSRQTIALTGVRNAKRGVYTITVLASPVGTMFVGDVLRAQVRVR